jgi:hypothetical protein
VSVKKKGPACAGINVLFLLTTSIHEARSCFADSGMRSLRPSKLSSPDRSCDTFGGYFAALISSRLPESRMVRWRGPSHECHI